MAQLESIYLTEARVYIAGVLMPVTHVTITTTFNRPPQAELVLPAYSELLYLGERDRIPVHIFVRETMVESPRFILLFEGFISETTYVNSALQRSIACVAVSHLDFLNDVQVKFMTQLEDFFTQVIDGEQDLYHYVKTSMLAFPNCLLSYGMVRNDKHEANKDKPIRFPSDYLESIYGYIQESHPPANSGLSDENGKPYTEDPPRKFAHASALTQYFGAQGRALKLLDRFERLPYFDEQGSDGKYAWEAEDYPFQGPDGEEGTMFPMIYGIKEAAAFDFITRGANNASPTQSMMELLQYLVEEMEYEFLFISNPAYHSPEKKDEKQEQNAKNEAKSKNTDPAAALVPQSVSQKIAAGAENKQTNSGENKEEDKEKKPAKLISSCVKPLFTDTMPPACNIMYRSLVDNVSMGVIHKGVPTRLQMQHSSSYLAKLAQGVAPTALIMYGLVDYYPSKKYPNFDPDSEAKAQGCLKYISSELLKEEKFTGPWVKQLHTPRWFHYLMEHNTKNSVKMKVNGEEVDASKVFKERFMRRQLLNLKYFNRQMQAQCMFDPYITPGFPGVVFDSGDSSFVFAGHVVTVIHTISPEDVNTQVAMNFVRPLHEAVEVKIPNAVSCIESVTHNKGKLSEIYQRILGADAQEFSEIENLVTGTTSETSPNNNPSVAYRTKRRNIASFDEYVSFMGFGVEYGEGPEGSQTPIRMTGSWLENRYDLPVYDVNTISDPIVPEKEQILPNKGEQQSSSGTVVKGTVTATNTPKGTIQEKVKKNAQAKKEGKVTRVATEVNVVSLLRAIAQKEFARVIYR